MYAINKWSKIKMYIGKWTVFGQYKKPLLTQSWRVCYAMQLNCQQQMSGLLLSFTKTVWLDYRGSSVFGHIHVYAHDDTNRAHKEDTHSRFCLHRAQYDTSTPHNGNMETHRLLLCKGIHTHTPLHSQAAGNILKKYSHIPSFREQMAGIRESSREREGGWER